jgi:hypothetical protein
MMKILQLLCLSLVLIGRVQSTAGVGPAIDDETVLKYFHGDNRLFGEKVRMLTPEDRAEFKNLGDEEIIDQCIKDYMNSGEYREALLHSQNPRIIPKVLPMLYLKGEGDKFPQNQWTTTLDIICEIVKTSLEFDPDTRRWAAGLPARQKPWKEGLEEMVNVVRAWYEENADRFKAGDFVSIRAGRELPPDLSRKPESLASSREELPAAESPSSSKIATVPVTGSSNLSTSEIGSKAYWIAFGIISVAALAFGYFWCRKTS